MLRFILKNKIRDEYSEMRKETYKTIDTNVPVLEEELLKGGHSRYGFDITDLIGVEIIQEGKSE